MNEKYLSPIHPIQMTRRHLPHWHQEGKLQFVTFHLADSLPQEVLRDLDAQREEWLRQHPEPRTADQQREYDQLFGQGMQEWLDRGAGSCLLRDKGNATIVKDSLEYYDEQRYLLHYFVVMPNHVHVLVELTDEYSLSTIVQGWKGYTAYAINKRMGHRGQLWTEEYYDTMIRSAFHYENVRSYIIKNIEHGGVLYGGF